MTGDDRPRGIIRALLEMLAEMEERNERTNQGRWSGDRTTVDYSVSISGLGEAPGTGGNDERETPAITTRQVDDGMLVAADLPGVREGDVTVEIDRDKRAVTIATHGDVLGRVPLDDGDWTVVDVSVNNDVMEVRLARE